MLSCFPRAILLPLVLMSLAAAGPAQAQNAPAIPIPPTPPAVVTPTVTVNDNVRTANRLWAKSPKVIEQPWLDTKIDLSLKDATIMDAVKKVVESAKGTYDQVESDFTLPDVRVTVEVKGVMARDALSAVARLGGAIAYVDSTSDTNNGTKTEKTIIWLRKRTPSNSGPVIYTGPAQSYAPSFTFQTQQQIDRAMKQANEAIAMAGKNAPFIYSLGRRTLPDKRVSLDKRDIDIRDALKDVLKQADFGYSLDADIPEGLKKSFTFSDIPISTALDVICDSAGIGWRTDNSGGYTVYTSAPGKNVVKPGNVSDSEKPTVLIGKKYAVPNKRN